MATEIIQKGLSSEMKGSYLDYAMSVIVKRALPDVRDGFKPVHRRIAYSMAELGLYPNKPFRKSARIVGDCLGKYHPHGDTSVYDAMVRMAQDWSLRYPLVSGHGNFGSIDGDGAAAMRYTEAKMDKLMMEMIKDIKKNTVDFVPNFSNDEEEPTVLPSRFPNLLVNGSTGIAVGMSTSIPSHNLNEVVNAISHYIDNQDCSVKDLTQFIVGPDFPTGGTIINQAELLKAYETGRGKARVRAKVTIEPLPGKKGRERIVVTEIPYQVNKENLIISIADKVDEKKITGISDLRDDSDRNGMAIVIELKKDADSGVVLNQLYKNTKMEDTFSIIMIALVDGEPKVLSLKDMIVHYVNHQKEVVTRRTQFDLAKAEARKHILDGYIIALDNIDDVIKTIKASPNSKTAQEKLIEKFGLSEVQAKAILDMKLQKLTGLEREKIENEIADLLEKIKYLKSLLEDENKLLAVIKEELSEIRDKFKDKRRTELTNVTVSKEPVLDLIPQEDVVVVLTNNGYVKRVPATSYKSQKKGGKGLKGSADLVMNAIKTTTTDSLLVFTDEGKAYKLIVNDVPKGTNTSKGSTVAGLLNLDGGVKIEAITNIDRNTDADFVVFCTKQGRVKKSKLSEYIKIRKAGIKAINLKEDDSLVHIEVMKEEDLVLITKKGMSIRFGTKEINPIGRVALGVKGISLKDGDEVVGMNVVRDEDCNVLVATERGMGKQTKLSEYPTQGRGGKGTITYKLSEKTGDIIGSQMVKEGDKVLVVSNTNVITLESKDIATLGKNTQGVSLMKTTDKTKVVSVTKL